MAMFFQMRPTVTSESGQLLVCTMRNCLTEAKLL